MAVFGSGVSYCDICKASYFGSYHQCVEPRSPETAAPQPIYPAWTTSTPKDYDPALHRISAALERLAAAQEYANGLHLSTCRPPLPLRPPLPDPEEGWKPCTCGGYYRPWSGDLPSSNTSAAQGAPDNFSCDQVGCAFCNPEG